MLLSGLCCDWVWYKLVWREYKYFFQKSEADDPLHNHTKKTNTETTYRKNWNSLKSKTKQKQKLTKKKNLSCILSISRLLHISVVIVVRFIARIKVMTCAFIIIDNRFSNMGAVSINFLSIICCYLGIIPSTMDQEVGENVLVTDNNCKLISWISKPNLIFFIVYQSKENETHSLPIK